jgi:hypothetical protein
MALPEDIILADPVLQRIFFDPRTVAPRSQHHAATVATLYYRISEITVLFMKAKKLREAERLQGIMRRHWFRIRELCDGYFVRFPPCYSDSAEHVQVFRHDAGAAEFAIDRNRRRALWHRHEQRAPTTATPV